MKLPSALVWLHVPTSLGLLFSPRLARPTARRLSSPSDAEFTVSRRRIFEGICTVGAGIISTSPIHVSAKETVDVKTTVPVKDLLSGLASFPQRDIIITGANSGVGLAGAKYLTAAGHRVVLACRTQAKADTAAAACEAFALAAAEGKNDAPFRAGGTAVGFSCDLADLESVRAFAKSRAGKPLDTLVLNAGLAMNTADTEAKRTAQGFELTVGTNHLGHFALANLLEPELKAKPTIASSSPPGEGQRGDGGGGGGRVVVTASPVHDPLSGGGNVGSKAFLGLDMAGLATAAARGDGRFDMVDGGQYDADKAYKDSKLCNLLFTSEASRRFGKDGVEVDAFSPGLIPSPDGFFRYQNQGFARAFQKVSGLAGVSETNEFGGAALAFMATAPSLPVATNGWYDTYPPGKHQLAVHDPSAEAMSEAEQKTLWELSAKLTGVATK